MHAQGVAKPLLPSLEAWSATLRDRFRQDMLLAVGGGDKAKGPRWLGAGSGNLRPESRRRAFSREEEEAILYQLGVLGPRGGATGVGAMALDGAAAGLWGRGREGEGCFEEEEEESEGLWGQEDGVATMPVSKVRTYVRVDLSGGGSVTHRINPL